MESDLGLKIPFVKGQDISVKNCWHFYTDGNAVDAMFSDRQDFVDGVNRIPVVKESYDITMLAFVLMDTHFHFVLHGDFDVCNKFVHEYVRRTSMSIAQMHGARKKLDGVDISHQAIDDDRYLKTVICYTIKNPISAGLPYMPWDYPWSSGPLYFRAEGTWSSINCLSTQEPAGLARQRSMLKTRSYDGSYTLTDDGMVFPGCFVDVRTVERIYRSARSYFYFLCSTKDTDVDGRGGTISNLSIPLQEMRQNKKDLCDHLFGTTSTRSLTTTQRIILARRLRTMYNSSTKQIARLCGLIYEEVKDLI